MNDENRQAPAYPISWSEPELGRTTTHWNGPSPEAVHEAEAVPGVPVQEAPVDEARVSQPSNSDVPLTDSAVNEPPQQSASALANPAPRNRTGSTALSVVRPDLPARPAAPESVEQAESATPEGPAAPPEPAAPASSSPAPAPEPSPAHDEVQPVEQGRPVPEPGQGYDQSFMDEPVVPDSQDAPYRPAAPQVVGQNDDIPDDALTIGRSRSNVIVLDDMLVSRRHIVITADEEGLLMRDLGSRNGTFVNGQRVTHAHLDEGDRIGIGASTFEVRDGWLVSV